MAAIRLRSNQDECKGQRYTESRNDFRHVLTLVVYIPSIFAEYQRHLLNGTRNGTAGLGTTMDTADGLA